MTTLENQKHGGDSLHSVVLHHGRTIWKYPLQITDLQNVLMPEGAQLLSAQMQGDTLCLWALVNPKASKRVRTIEIIGTGNPCEDVPRKYISTTQMAGGALIWHVFERE
jgi:hypothetical protein